MTADKFLTHINHVLQMTPMEHSLGVICDVLATYTQSSVVLQDGTTRNILATAGDTARGQYELRKKVPMDVHISHDLILIRASQPFDANEGLLAHIACTICAIFLRQKSAMDKAEKAKKRDSIRVLINALSFSELEACGEIINKIAADTEGIVNGGKIAKKLGFAPSIVTSTLKKLDASGMVETRSLGMKGSYVKIKEPLLVEEMKKL